MLSIMQQTFFIFISLHPDLAYAEISSDSVFMLYNKFVVLYVYFSYKKNIHQNEMFAEEQK